MGLFSIILLWSLFILVSLALLSLVLFSLFVVSSLKHLSKIVFNSIIELKWIIDKYGKIQMQY